MPNFTTSQLKRFSNIFDNAGQVLLGTVVITPVLNPKPPLGSIGVALLGSCLTLFAWWISLRIERMASAHA